MAARDIIQAAGGSAATSAAVYVEDVFSTYLYTGTGATQTINNGIDLATKGGLVWIKSRTDATSQYIEDTNRGASQILQTNSTAANIDVTGSFVTAFNTNGFDWNAGASSYVAWTFRKQPKFFDIVTYTGNGTANYQYQTIQHNLGCVPGLVIVKPTSGTGNWAVGFNDGTDYGWFRLNTTGANTGNDTVTSFTATTFSVQSFTSGMYATDSCNTNGVQYVAYLFARSNSGGFGPAGTDSVVACGSFVGSTSNISLGWEPQYVMIKRTDTTGSWWIGDNMRGVATGGDDKYLIAESSAAEGTIDFVDFTATGFTQKLTTSGTANFIYLAIRRGPMKTPTDATKVYATQTYGGGGTAPPVFVSPFPVDLGIYKRTDNTNAWGIGSRLQGTGIMSSSTTSAEYADGSQTYDFQNGYYNTTGILSTLRTWMFRRAPGFFDVVCYTGTGSATTVAHNLGVAPELMIVKSRSDSSLSWPVYYGDYTAFAYLNASSASSTGSSAAWNANPTASVFSVGTSLQTNYTSSAYVAYLFATCPGVSKVFSFTGNGSSQTINCGFAAGARFVLIKRTDSTGDWYVWDTARGIVSANDPHLSLNTTAAEVTTDDTIDPDSSGFIVNQVAATNVNVNNATYIGLAIA